jgi:hypothetical protein
MNTFGVSLDFNQVVLPVPLGPSNKKVFWGAGSNRLKSDCMAVPPVSCKQKLQFKCSNCRKFCNYDVYFAIINDFDVLWYFLRRRRSKATNFAAKSPIGGDCTTPLSPCGRCNGGQSGQFGGGPCPPPRLERDTLNEMSLR